MINELGRSPTRLENVCFANNERASIAGLYCCVLFTHAKHNKKNDKRFNNCGYLLFFLMDIFLKHLWLIPDILKWRNCKIFTKRVPSQTPFRSNHLLST